MVLPHLLMGITCRVPWIAPRQGSPDFGVAGTRNTVSPPEHKTRPLSGDCGLDAAWLPSLTKHRGARHINQLSVKHEEWGGQGLRLGACLPGVTPDTPSPEPLEDPGPVMANH